MSLRMQKSSPNLCDCVILTINGKKYQVEIADTPWARLLGLSGRLNMSPDHGMLFIWPDEAYRSMCMMGMNFPLDIVFIDKNGNVVGTVENAPVPTPDQSGKDLPQYVSPAPCRSVLELLAGEVRVCGIKAGDHVDGIPDGTTVVIIQTGNDRLHLLHEWLEKQPAQFEGVGVSMRETIMPEHFSEWIKRHKHKKGVDERSRMNKQAMGGVIGVPTVSGRLSGSDRRRTFIERPASAFSYVVAEKQDMSGPFSSQDVGIFTPTYGRNGKKRSHYELFKAWLGDGVVCILCDDDCRCGIECECKHDCICPDISIGKDGDEVVFSQETILGMLKQHSPELVREKVPVHLPSGRVIQAYRWVRPAGSEVPSSPEYREISEYIHSFSEPLDRTVTTLGQLFEDFEDAEISYRLKDPESAAEKMKRKQQHYTRFGDIAGARVVFDTRDEVLSAVNMLDKAFAVVERENYLDGHPGGPYYRAYHMKVNVDGKDIEVQIRTKCHDNIAIWVHDRLYKIGDEKISQEDREMASDYARRFADYCDGKVGYPPECPEKIKRMFGECINE